MIVQVILLGKIRNLGGLGDTVKVKPGFARNYLIPQKKAVYASTDNIAKFEKRREELEKAAAEQYQQALARQQTLQALEVVTITTKAGEEGKLFGSVGTRDIAEALNKAGANIEKREIRLPEGALRMLGDYEISIDLESDLTAIVKIKIVGEG
jgi:large subunit ribosomal protein L9